MGNGDEVARASKDSQPHTSSTEYDEVSVGRISSLMLDVRELQEPVLYAAALSLMPIEWARHLIYKGKRRCLEKLCIIWGEKGE